jgi:hypothetical protein
MPVCVDCSVCLVISLQTEEPGPLLKIFSTVLDAWAARPELSSVPVHWSFPACALESRTGSETRLVPVLKERLAPGRDMLLPRGYSAAPHTLLLSDDIRRDIEWAVANPWQSGIKDLFNKSDPIVFPASPDIFRGSARSIYETEFDSLLLEFYNPASGSAGFLLKEQSIDQAARFLTLFHYSVDEQNIKGLRRALPKHFKTSPGVAVIRVDVYTGTTPERIASNFSMLGEILSLDIEYQRLAEISKPSVPVGERSMGTIPVLSTPSDVFGRSSAGYSRAEINARVRSVGAGKKTRRPNRSTTKQRLKAATQGSPPQALPQGEPGSAGIADRTLIADMFGTVSLFDRDVSIRFDEGQLTGIMVRDEPVLCGKPASSYYIEESGRYDFANDGAFSFEGENFHGLRASQSIRGSGIAGKGSVVRDFFFLDGENSLFVSTVCVRPIFIQETRIQTWACFELPLFEFNQTAAVSIESKTLDGEKSFTDLTGYLGDYLFTGNAFRLQSANYSIFITYPETELNMFHLLPIRIERTGRKTIVSISPGGCYLPASSERYSGYADHTVFAIDVKEAGTATYPKVRSDVFAETGPPWYRFAG